MTQNPFDFEFSKAMFQFGSKSEWQNLSLRVYCIAHVSSMGTFHKADIDYFEHDGCKFSANLVWLIDRDLYEEIEEAAFQHGESKFNEVIEFDVEND